VCRTKNVETQGFLLLDYVFNIDRGVVDALMIERAVALRNVDLPTVPNVSESACVITTEIDF
jgi:hypothetical protein